MTRCPRLIELADALKASADAAGCDQSLIVVGSEELKALLSHIYEPSIGSAESTLSARSAVEEEDV